MYRYVPLQRSHGSEEKVFDLRSDPEQRTNIRHTSRGKFVAARLGHRYDAARSEALRMRNKAIAEGRMKGPNQGKGLVLSPHDYHCSTTGRRGSKRRRTRSKRTCAWAGETTSGRAQSSRAAGAAG